MDFELVESLWQSMTIIEAQEQLKQLTVADWPNMKKGARDKMHRDLFSKAYPSELKKKNYVSLEDLGKVLGR